MTPSETLTKSGGSGEVCVCVCVLVHVSVLGVGVCGCAHSVRDGIDSRINRERDSFSFINST